MNVRFETRCHEARALRDLTLQRTRFVMRRLHGMVPHARVQLDDINGPRGGVDKRCRVELRAPVGKPVVVTSVAGDWRHALDLALTRAVRALLRWWTRRRRIEPAPVRLPPS